MVDPASLQTDGAKNSRAHRTIRWWPAWVILIFAAVGLVLISRNGRQHQDQNLAMTGIALGTAVLLMLWWVFFSRARAKLRLALLGGVAGVLILLAALFRIHGVTGDLVPILQWRWSSIVAITPEHPLPISAVTNAQNNLIGNYPQFLGPERNGILPAINLARDWQAQPPQLMWMQSVGPGWSGFAVVDKRAFTQEQQGENETVSCYDLLAGAPLWSYAYPAHFQSSLAGEGPRATPTVTSNRVYTVGSTGILNCLDRDTGKLIWSKDIVRENHSSVNVWGISCSPLVVDDLVIVETGGADNRSLVAYRESTGEFAWGNGSASAGYSSPFIATLAGQRQIVIFNSGEVSAHNPTDGTNLWRYPWPGGQPNVSSPTVLPNDQLLVSSGYGIGSELLQIQTNFAGKLQAECLWKSMRLKAKFTDVIYLRGFLYGLDDGIMVCVDAATGEQKWKEGRYGHGQEILVGDLLLITAESGEVILMEPNPDAAHELTRFTALQGKTWNPPALAGQFLLVRNDKQAACYRLPLTKP